MLTELHKQVKFWHKMYIYNKQKMIKESHLDRGVERYGSIRLYIEKKIIVKIIVSLVSTTYFKLFQFDKVTGM